MAGAIFLAPIGTGMAFIVGLTLSVLGGGGTILAVPIFVYALGYETKTAIAMSLAVVGLASLLSVVGHWRDGNVNPRVAALFGVVAMAGTYLGARLAVFLSGSVQLLLFAAVLLVAAYFMVLNRAPKPGAAAPGRRSLVSTLILAPPVGVLTGLVGVGGGFLIVPALVLLGRLPIREAIGTSLLVIALNSAIGLVSYLGHVQVDWVIIAAFAGVAMAGTVLGNSVVRFVSPVVLKRGFAVFLVGMSLFILFQNRQVFLLG